MKRNAGRTVLVAIGFVTVAGVAALVFSVARGSAETSQALTSVFNFLYVIATITLVAYTIHQIGQSKRASEVSAFDALTARLDPRGPRVSMRHVKMEFHCANKPHDEEDTERGSAVLAIEASDRLIVIARLILENHGGEPTHIYLRPNPIGGFDTQPDFALAPGESCKLTWEAGFSGVEARSFALQGGWVPGSWMLTWEATADNLEGSVMDLLRFEGHYKPIGVRGTGESQHAVWYRHSIPFQRWGQYATLERTYSRLQPADRKRELGPGIKQLSMSPPTSVEGEGNRFKWPADVNPPVPPPTQDAEGADEGDLRLIITITRETPVEMWPVTEYPMAVTALMSCLGLDEAILTLSDAFDEYSIGDWWVTVKKRVVQDLSTNGYLDLQKDGWRVTAELPTHGGSVSSRPMPQLWTG